MVGIPAKLLKKVDDKTKSKTQLMEELEKAYNECDCSKIWRQQCCRC